MFDIYYMIFFIKINLWMQPIFLALMLLNFELVLKLLYIFEVAIIFSTISGALCRNDTVPK
jgi:hypothetical protein